MTTTAPAVAVREIRLALGMTQIQFAYNLGVGLTAVSAWENGHRMPGRLAMTAIKNLAFAYGIDPSRPTKGRRY